MKAVDCPYCEARSYTSSPEIMARCASCGKPFAEVVTGDGQVLVIIDNQFPDADTFAGELTARWRADGDGRRRAIVDRRLNREGYDKQDRRRYNSE